jgi:hypothetical protein
MNNGHDLLHLTAPDDNCDLLFVRGSFSNNSNAILARAQRGAGGKSTFDLKVFPDTSSAYTVGQVYHQGLVNFLWPYIERELSCPGSKNGIFHPYHL